ncbi:hypothetical protein CL6EHI_127320 [Entamoeba histolytica]|uniref:Uncharacterized protein n=2 Tax=Entamoeba histolytica TaxID=5759 RepID=C4LWY0_ENTH1|nr:hypothetical protein EHI_127050 [Entamoeba histolytica HM-1:IMSS]XP_652158.1 hypothetical protein EHI_127320 [Entamoeba histolytica HM-1:IMSS]GAT93226.1 hypothetical protein CL6EHI_127050 [Entamoeba histolytica]EAL46168.1 hypothetical protein EHI_127050 [Entamoeba histolytica HM-1:IMSS]EAL46772.1 hypothetical protein EHI_127320 [Entamoeba histolytica HM-1:IMSS]GAT93254.1 hypothetical protein CL6EHI_127320 [Entamoeba histolytica]|eukprot:XP_651555.1 hypothetical protein EHI_127050 [Entamoeba histolytica HM-1:IMSS]
MEKIIKAHQTIVDNEKSIRKISIDSNVMKFDISNLTSFSFPVYPHSSLVPLSSLDIESITILNRVNDFALDSLNRLAQFEYSLKEKQNTLESIVLDNEHAQKTQRDEFEKQKNEILNKVQSKNQQVQTLQKEIEKMLYEINTKKQTIQTKNIQINQLKEKKECEFRNLLCSTVHLNHTKESSSIPPKPPKQKQKRTRKQTVLFPNLVK